jgi:uncharacterized protein YdeI (YjbR/CyaY-like superfamily)
MNGQLNFPDRAAFRAWLEQNCTSNEGVWLLFGKKGGPITLTAVEALEEALCFGWIDGQMQSIDDKTYRKYFSARRQNSNWSEKNKALAEKLQLQGLMSDHGKSKIDDAKESGRWDAPKAPAITQEQIAFVSSILSEYQPAYANFMAMPPSVKKTYTAAYLDAKTDSGRKKRLECMVHRLNKNLKPM